MKGKFSSILRVASSWCSVASRSRKNLEHDLNSDDDPSTCSEDVECACCFEECAFGKMIQCEDGHLFCRTCLARHVENSIFGDLSKPLSCVLMSGCTSIYPRSEVKKCFSKDDWKKYEQRLAEHSVANARIENMEYCFHCHHPWEVDPGTKSFKCLNQICMKETCVDCNGPNHRKKPCKISKKNPEDFLRIEVEESKTNALMRVCSHCHVRLVKSDGCNKVQCRCGQVMCYFCRKDIKGYSHFCSHKELISDGVRIPCDECSLCPLWRVEDEKNVLAAEAATMEKWAYKYPEAGAKKTWPYLFRGKQYSKRRNDKFDDE